MEVIETGEKNMVSLTMGGKLLQNKIIMIYEEINAYTVTQYQQQLLYLTSKCKKGDIISIYINTPGGSVYDGLGLYDLMQYIKNKDIIIRTINIGKACSMGSILLMAGSNGYRESLPHCSVMIHEISTAEYGKTSEVEDAIKEVKRLQNTMSEIINKHASPELNNLCVRKDLWLSSEEALKYKIIDKIL